jgi:hypothetical protein
MGSQNISSSTTTALTTGVPNYSISSKALDYVTGGKEETYWYFTDASTNLTYYKNDAALYSGLNTLADWVCGRGFTPISTMDKAKLSLIRGNGKETFESIIRNSYIVKKLQGDSFAEIIRATPDNNKSQLINLRTISPERMRLVINPDGMLKRYDVLVNGEWKPLEKERVFHLQERIGDEIHGTGVLTPLKVGIDMFNEAKSDWRRISHRSSLRVLYVDVFNTNKIAAIREQYKEGIKNGEVLILPGKRGEVEFEDLKLPDVNAFLNWIQYQENFFYQSLRIPKAIMGGTVAVSEGNSKVGILSFEQVYLTEQRQLEQDIWSQLFIMGEFDSPDSMMPQMQENEVKNTSQTGMQPKDTQMTGGRE